MSIIWLIFAHFFGDFGLQSEWMAANKGSKWYVMLSHCILWTGCISIALQYLGLFAMWKVLFLVVGHGVMDYWKVRFTSKWLYIYPDQAWHGIQLLIVYFN